MTHSPFDMLRKLSLPLIAAMLVVFGHGAIEAPAQTTITLNLSVRFDVPESPITIARVARIDGPDAARYGELVLHPRADAAASVSLAEVRSTLQAAGANFGKLTLRGSSCRIEVPSSPPPEAKPPRTERTRAGPDYQVVDVSGPPTLRTAIARRLAALHSVTPDAIQIAFDEKDATTLAMPYTQRQVVQVQPAASVSSSRVPLRVSIFAGDKVVSDHRLTADVLLRRDVLVATREIDRRELITDSDVRVEPRWIAPGNNPPAREAVVGSQARSRVKDGQMLTGTDFESPVVIKRGDVVYVQCLSGSIVVQARARALGPGREGETISFQMEGADDSFMARVAGRGRAVMLAAPAFDAPRAAPGPGDQESSR